MWITKYALADGISEAEGRIDGHDPGYFVAGWGYFKIGVDAFPTREAAVVRVNEQRRRKIAALLRQIERLEKLDFNARINHV
jgi:hypothetical protein